MRSDGRGMNAMIDPRIAEALEPAPPAWPPSRRDGASVGAEEAERYLEGRVIYEQGGDMEHLTAFPERYSPQRAGPRLTGVIARLPRDLFDILASGRREVRFHIQPALSRSSPPIAEVRPSGPGHRRTYVIVLRRAVEIEGDNIFLAIVVHELCHVVLDHPAAIAWPRDPYELGRATARMENEALQLADEIGFKKETGELRDLLVDIAEERGERGEVLPDGSIRVPGGIPKLL